MSSRFSCDGDSCTAANNVHAATDTDHNDTPDPGSEADGGPNLLFDFPLDLTQDPSTYRPAAVTNLFFWNNYVHDVSYRYGFDEAAGNFQGTNHSGQGVGGDAVNAFTVSGKKNECSMATARLNCICAVALQEIGKSTSPSRSSFARAVPGLSSAISAKTKSTDAVGERAITSPVSSVPGGRLGAAY